MSLRAVLPRNKPIIYPSGNNATGGAINFQHICASQSCDFSNISNPNNCLWTNPVVYDSSRTRIKTLKKKGKLWRTYLRLLMHQRVYACRTFNLLCYSDNDANLLTNSCVRVFLTLLSCWKPRKKRCDVMGGVLALPFRRSPPCRRRYGNGEQSPPPFLLHVVAPRPEPSRTRCEPNAQTL